MEKASEEWERWCGLEASEKAKMPGEWGKQAPFRQLLIIRALKPGRITNALQNFCESIMGSRYVNQARFSLLKTTAMCNPGCRCVCLPLNLELELCDLKASAALLKALLKGFSAPNLPIADVSLHLASDGPAFCQA